MGIHGMKLNKWIDFSRFWSLPVLTGNRYRH